MYKSKKIYLLLLFSLFSVTAYDKLLPQTYYVSIDGNDANLGNKESPFRTLQKATRLLKSGDILIVKSGVYREQNIALYASGTKKNPIVVKAEKHGEVYLYGTRQKEMESGGGIGFYIDKSYVEIEGFHFENYETGVTIEKAMAVHIKNSIFKNNGESGITIIGSINPKIAYCQFIGEALSKSPMTAIQDYAIAVYFTNGALIENNYIYGVHNQSISFKEGCNQGIARRNIIEGALYTAIYLGQNRREENRKISTNLVAEYNIVREARGYRVKSPIRIDNVRNVEVHDNYLEGFDKTNNAGGVNIFSDALGKIKIYNNIMSFAINNINSVGIYKSNTVSGSTVIEIEHNTFYDVYQDFSGELLSNGSYFRENIAQTYSKQYYTESGAINNYQGNLKLAFIKGKPQLLPFSFSPKNYDFKSYYDRLVGQFHLKEKSNPSGKGYTFSP